jgi:hypothetical protein
MKGWGEEAAAADIQVRERRSEGKRHIQPASAVLDEIRASRPVSRVLYGLRFPSNVAAIPLGRMLPSASCNPPGHQPRNGLGELPLPRCPYSVLLPAGFAVPLALPLARWAFTPPFHPYHAAAQRRWRAVCSLWHFPWGRPRRPLAGAVFPWSPDFPHMPPFGF